MRKIIVLSMLSLDGVIQGPGGPEEDTSGGFEYGGWTATYGDEIFAKALQKELQPTDYILGRKTFEIWEPYWRNHADFWQGINEGTKYVMSNTREKSDWNKSVFFRSVTEIQNIKSSDGPDIQVWGSGELIQILLENDLIDELRLKIYPLTLGKGKKLFDKGTVAAAFKLADCTITSKGVILANYERAGSIKTGSVGDKK
jgi:dihydrofolate reductase